LGAPGLALDVPPVPAAIPWNFALSRPSVPQLAEADFPEGHGSDNVMLGVGLKIASVFVFVAMASLLKAAEGIPSGELVFFRSFFAIFPIVIFLAWKRELAIGFETKHLFGHVWRGLVGVGSMSLGFYGLTKLPLPESITIGYATPLIIVALSVVFLHEQVRLYRWSAVLVGLVGVIIILLPRLTVLSGGGIGVEEAYGALAALAAACFAAIAMLLVRRLVHTERTATIVLYFSITSTLFSLLSVPFGWVWPTPQQAAYLVCAGFAGGIAQILLTECYRHADMSIIAPFEYSSLILSVVIGYMVFGDVPTVQMLIGGAIVVASGIFIILREHQLGLERRRSKEVSTPQG
jgi:drug/metabolite transporter (DMT)-like permease